MSNKYYIIGRPGQSLEQPIQKGDLIVKKALAEGGLEFEMVVLETPLVSNDLNLSLHQSNSVLANPCNYLKRTKEMTAYGVAKQVMLTDQAGFLLPAITILRLSAKYRFLAKVVQIAINEEQNWTKPNGRKFHESSLHKRARLQEYWGATNGSDGAALVQSFINDCNQKKESANTRLPQVLQALNQNPDDLVLQRERRRLERIIGTNCNAWYSYKPWSAAFISWLMRQGGAANHFRYASGHIRYIFDGLQNRERHILDRFWLHSIEGGRLENGINYETGDLLCFNRRRSSFSYLSLKQDYFDRGRNPSGATHCDIIVEKIKLNYQSNTATYLVTIGGNIGTRRHRRSGLTVGKKYFKLDPFDNRITEGWYFELQQNQIVNRARIESVPNSLFALLQYKPNNINSVRRRTTLPPIAPPSLTESYGGFNLKRGDNDNSQRYSGVIVTGGIQTHVAELQADLNELGFRIAQTPDGDFGRYTQWAVREFQIYAKMPNIAQENALMISFVNRRQGNQPSDNYISRLRQVSNTRIYNGRISGVVNTETRNLIQHWKRNNWRCPVIVQAYSVHSGVRRRLLADNIWRHNEMTNPSPRVFVKDFTNYYQLPATRQGQDFHVLGEYVNFSTWGGPGSVRQRHSWLEAALTRQNLVGKPTNRLSSHEESTYKVVRSVSEVENMGRFDVVNSYDNAIVSLGPCHWTLGIINSNGGVARGELSGYLAYLKAVDINAFQEAFGFFGADIDRTWGTNGTTLFNRGQRKYSARVQQQTENILSLKTVQAKSEAQYFQNWHWFYRFIMAGRTIEGFRRRMWDMARIRIRDIRSKQLESLGVNIGGLAANNLPTIGEVFTSEHAISLIVNLHIWRPAYIAGAYRNNIYRSYINEVIEFAVQRNPNIDWTLPLNTWNDAHEEALIVAMSSVIGNINWFSSDSSKNTNIQVKLIGRINRMIGSQSFQNLNLSRDRNTLRFDSAGLPPSP